MTESMFSMDTIVKVVEGISVAELEGEAVLPDINSGQYFGLNEVGVRIMDLLKEPSSIQAVIEVLIQEFEVEDDQLRDDIVVFLEDMAKHELIQVVD